MSGEDLCVSSSDHENPSVCVCVKIPPFLLQGHSSAPITAKTSALLLMSDSNLPGKKNVLHDVVKFKAGVQIFPCFL